MMRILVTIHVQDLARAHVVARESLINPPACRAYNLGMRPHGLYRSRGHRRRRARDQLAGAAAHRRPSPGRSRGARCEVRSGSVATFGGHRASTTSTRLSRRRAMDGPPHQPESRRAFRHIYCVNRENAGLVSAGTVCAPTCGEYLHVRIGCPSSAPPRPAGGCQAQT